MSPQEFEELQLAVSILLRASILTSDNAESTYVTLHAYVQAVWPLLSFAERTKTLQVLTAEESYRANSQDAAWSVLCRWCQEHMDSPTVDMVSATKPAPVDSGKAEFIQNFVNAFAPQMLVEFASGRTLVSGGLPGMLRTVVKYGEETYREIQVRAATPCL